MKAFRFILLAAFASFLIVSCSKKTEPAEEAASGQSGAVVGGQESVQDDVSQKDVVKIAVGSPDHTSLVAALKAADLVTSLSNAGPFTVFAPTDAAFAKLPAGTVENLLKPENKDALADILQHHVTLSVYDVDALTDGKSMWMVDGTNALITKKDGATYFGGAKILGSVRASNGIVHVIDAVVVPGK
ncbi:fasciclin domain-containing protein [soil metagenome]